MTLNHLNILSSKALSNKIKIGVHTVLNTYVHEVTAYVVLTAHVWNYAGKLQILYHACGPAAVSHFPAVRQELLQILQRSVQPNEYNSYSKRSLQLYLCKLKKTLLAKFHRCEADVSAKNSFFFLTLLFLISGDFRGFALVAA